MLSISSTTTSTLSSVLDTPLLAWLLKTRMSFYQDDDLILPWWFGLCCWNFALGGACMFLVEPQWMMHRQPLLLLGVWSVYYPYRTVAWLLILVQSPLSFLADYIYMTQDSYWHVVDRLLAVPLMICEVTRFALVAQHSILQNQQRPRPGNGNSNGGGMPLSLVGLSLLSILFAFYSFKRSTQAQSELNHDGFIFWHTAWHLYPILASAISLYNFYARGGWKQSTRKYFYQIEWHLLKKVA